MAAEGSSDWSTSSNDALKVSLVTPASGSSKTLASFKPQYTYALFGDEESIFGYQGLKINLRFNACDMRPNLQISYEKKFKAVNETEAQDLKPILEDFLPKTAFEKSSTFETIINEEKIYTAWTPPGTLRQSFEEGDSKFELWQAGLGDLEAQQFLKRVQIFVPFFIDGGSFIDLEEKGLKRWSLFFLFEVKKDKSDTISPYVFLGYATTYRYYLIKNFNDTKKKREGRPLANFKFPIDDPKNFFCRARISQFIILPPFQGKGHGARLYNAICFHYRKVSSVIEITVEDPNETFDNLRDYNDLAYLRSRPDFLKLHLNEHVRLQKKGRFPIDRVLVLKDVEKVRKLAKLAPRQFYRVLEMQLLSQIPLHMRQSRIYEKVESDSKEDAKHRNLYRLWQLVVRSRLHRHNKEMLMQLARAERADRLEIVCGTVEQGYAKMLLALDAKGPIAPDEEEEEGEEESMSLLEVEGNGEAEVERVNGGEKRGAEPGAVEGEPEAKKAKLDNITASANGDEGNSGESKDVEMQDSNV